MTATITMITLISIELMLLLKRFRIRLYEMFIRYVRPFLTWRILVCYLPLWFIATGWTYVALAIGNAWWRSAGGVWLAFMWMPWCPEKIITIPCAILLHKKLFPNHSVKALEDMLTEERAKLKKK